MVETKPDSELTTLMLEGCPVNITVRPHSEAADISPDVHWFWQTHPRITFLKNLAIGTSIIDFGAGDGSLFTTRSDYLPSRPDQRFYALDLFKGKHFDEYDDYQIADFEESELKWADASVGAVFACHIIEHLRDTTRFYRECSRVLKPGGLVYIETPNPFAERLPDSGTIRSQGWPAVASNFFEDSTHVRAVSVEEVSDAGTNAGFLVESRGSIRSEYFSDALLQYAKITDDKMFGMFGLWSKIGWAHYAVLRKPDQLDDYLGSLKRNS